MSIINSPVPNGNFISFMRLVHSWKFIHVIMENLEHIFEDISEIIWKEMGFVSSFKYFSDHSEFK